MKKYSILIFVCFFSFLHIGAIGQFNPNQPQKQCYNLYWKIDDAGIEADKNIGIIVDRSDIIAVQDDEYLEVNPSDITEDYIGYDISGLVGDTKLLQDNDYTTSLSLNPLYGNEILISFYKNIDSETAKFIYVDTSSFYDKTFYYSIDGKNFTLFNHYDFNKYTFKYLKVIYTPKPQKTESEIEIINIPEISIKDQKQLFIVHPLSNNPIEIFSQNTCNYGFDTSDFNNPDLQLLDESPIYNINLTTKRDYPKLTTDIEIDRKVVSETADSKKLEKQDTQNFPIFPPLDKIVYAIIGFAFILVISLYIRENAKLKSEKGILPQNSVFGIKTKKDVKKLFQAIKTSTEELKTIRDIESIELTIGKSKKKKTFKSEKIIKLLGVITSHYKKNKNVFLPGELKQIYTSIIDNFKNVLHTDEHKKALSFIDEFIEKGGKLVINKKKNSK